MPWNNGNYPLSYRDLTDDLRAKAVQIANVILQECGDEQLAVEMGRKLAIAIEKKNAAKPEGAP